MISVCFAGGEAEVDGWRDGVQVTLIDGAAHPTEVVTALFSREQAVEFAEAILRAAAGN